LEKLEWYAENDLGDIYYPEFEPSGSNFYFAENDVVIAAGGINRKENQRPSLSTRAEQLDLETFQL